MSVGVLVGIIEEISSEFWKDASDVLSNSCGIIIVMLLLLLILKQRNKRIMTKRLDKLTAMGQISLDERRMIEERLKLRRVSK
jgi:hypothetical protein